MGLFYAPTILPVDLLNFTAKNDKNLGVVLSWKTGSEINNEGFYILWKTDNKEWESLAFVNGFGNSTQTNTYQFIHPNPSKGENYYKLAQKDFDGYKICSDIVSISWESEFIINVFPNPANNHVQIVSKDLPIDRIEIYTSEGDLSETFAVNNKDIILNIIQLPRSIYFFKVYTFDSVITKKVIVTY